MEDCLNALEAPITELKGVGGRRAETLKRLGLETLGDLIGYFPRTYLDMANVSAIAELEDGVPATVKAVITSDITEKRTGRNGALLLYKFIVNDGEDEMEIVLFNQRYTASGLKKGGEYLFYGKPEATGFFKSMKSPLIEAPENASVFPVYPLTQGISQKLLRSLTAETLRNYADGIGETLPATILSEFSLISLSDAYKNIHFPESAEMLAAARKRLITEELLYFLLGMNILRRKNRRRASVPLNSPVDMSAFFSALPFSLTNAQHRVINECISDMKKPLAMSRLLQGDVGSGKTAVAAALVYYTKMCGCQSTIMAPTEVLASQHYSSLASLFKKTGINCALLTGSTPTAERKIIDEGLRNGEIDLLIGTHAIIQKNVKFNKLALAVADEQHRFGVNQRSALTGKGQNPHSLIMSATPIPRTMALILYGDLDVSLIDELPAGRLKTSSFVVGTESRDRMYAYLREQILAGNQAYVVCPLIEENEELDASSVITLSKQLADKYLKYLDVEYLHGKMPPKEKDAIMKRFADGEIKVLVSTTVIEVGINVPNATVMIIENAERFGLSQLHQLRGRVGRGTKKSRCFLVSDAEGTTRERLENFCSTNDGFEISRQDLALRGPGDFFGSRQHGLPDLKIASLSDMDTLHVAQHIAEHITSDKVWFTKKENALIANAVVKMFKSVSST